jgi:hypothetical protein
VRSKEREDMGAAISKGYVFVSRDILSSTLWQRRPEERIAAITSIVVANHQAVEWHDGRRDIQIGRGQFVRTWADLAQSCNLSHKTTRRAIDRLVEATFLSRSVKGKYSLYSIPKYGIYQDLDRYGREKELPAGAILIARKILESALWKMSAQDRVVAITCLLVANYTFGSAESGEREITLARGQFSAAWEKLARWCRLSMEKTQESVARLITAEFLTKHTEFGIHIFNIPKYEHYQDPSKYSETGRRSGADAAPLETPDLPFPPVPVTAERSPAGQDLGSTRAASGQLLGSSWAANKKDKNYNKGEEGEAVPAPVLEGFEARGAPPPLPPTVTELVKAYQKKFPGVMGWKKTVHQVLLFESRGGVIAEALGALETETRPRLPIWKILDPLVDRKSCLDSWIPPERRATADADQGSDVPERSQDRGSRTSRELPAEVHRLPMEGREGHFG